MNRLTKVVLVTICILGVVLVWLWFTAGSRRSLPPPHPTQPITATTPCGPPTGCCCSQDGYWLNDNGKPTKIGDKWVRCEKPDRGCPRAFPQRALDSSDGNWRQRAEAVEKAARQMQSGDGWDGGVLYFPSGDGYEPITPQPICHYPSSCYCNCKRQWIGVTGQVDYEQRDFCVGADLCLDCPSGGWKKDCVRRVQERHLPNIRTRVENENMDLR